MGEEFDPSRNEIDRNRLRFSGIGPRIDSNNPSKTPLWPRDSLNLDQECRKILTRDVEVKILDNVIKNRIKSFIRDTVDGFRSVNVTSLFERICPYGQGYFDRIPFEIHYALEAYTPYNQLLTLINQAINAAIKLSRKKKSDTNLNNHILLFGCNYNHKLFKQHIAWIIKGSVKLRKIKMGWIVWLSRENSMDVSTVTWLAGVDKTLQFKIFTQMLFFIIKFVLEMLRRYFYITMSNPYLHQLFYYRYDLWQKMHNRAVKLLKDQKVLKETEDRDFPLNRCSKLKFYLKKDNLRPICTSFRTKVKDNDTFTGAALDFVASRLGCISRFSLDTLLAELRIFRRKLDSGEIERLYFVRGDIKDCFQSVDQVLLCKLVMESLNLYCAGGNIRFNELCCLPKPNRMTRRMKTFKILTLEDVKTVIESNKYAEVHKTDSYDMSLENFEKNYLRHQLVEPIVRESRHSKVCYYQKKGLRQGSKFSPTLCYIYLQKAFAKHLAGHLGCDDCKIFCYVDDILFISSNLEKSQQFMRRMLIGFKDFNLRMNLNKLACNFPCQGLDTINAEVCELRDHLIFYKQKICIDTLKCSHDYNCEGLDLQYTFQADPYIQDEKTFLAIAKKSKFNLIHLDYMLNGLDQVIENIFEKILLIAHRIATLILINFNLKRKDRQNGALLISLLKESAKKAYKVKRSGSRRNMIDNDLTFAEIRLLSVAAYKATWSRTKMSHRKNELDKLSSTYKRYKMRYLVVPPRSEIDVINRWISRRDIVVKKVENLMHEFKDGHLVKAMNLPSKN